MNTVVKDSMNIGQLWKAEAKEEKLLSVVMGDQQLLKDANLEDIQNKECRLTINVEEENDEESVEFLEEVPNELEYF